MLAQSVLFFKTLAVRGSKCMLKKIMNFFKKLVLEERSPRRLAFSFCLGNFIAFSPFLGLHTAMLFACSWAFRLNLAVMLGASMAINNVWTLGPIYMADYVFGYWLVHKATFLGSFVANPHWMTFVNTFFEDNLGLAQPCIWSFLIGGNLIVIIIVDFGCVPVSYYLYCKYVSVGLWYFHYILYF